MEMCEGQYVETGADNDDYAFTYEDYTQDACQAADD